MVAFTGSLDNAHIGPLWQKITAFLKEKDPSNLVFDFREVTGFDTAGMALLRRLEAYCGKKGGSCEQRNLPEKIRHFGDSISGAGTGEEPEAPGPSFIESVGIRGKGQAANLKEAVRFFGDFFSTLVSAARRPRKIVLTNFLNQLEKVGADAIPLVAALSALMGLVIVFQGLATSNKFGSDILIADMVAISVTKQMAPMLTAIIIAGRSGAAFAAEIGSMKIRQELDVLSVMNFDNTEFLVLPRVIGMTVATPLLTMIGDAAGILGGMVTSMMVLDLSAVRFLGEVRGVLSPNDIYTGLIKGAGFGYLVAMTGCFHGLKTRNTADSVGTETTAAVVSGILFIILADALFAMLFSNVGW